MHNWLFSAKSLLWIRTYFKSKNLTLKLIHDAYSAYLLFLDMNAIFIIISLAVYAVWVQLPFCHQFFNVVVRSLPHQGWRVAVGASDAVPQGEVLPVVVVEEEVVVCVVSWTVDDVFHQVGHAVVSVVDGDGPYVDEHVQD